MSGRKKRNLEALMNCDNSKDRSLSKSTKKSKKRRQNSSMNTNGNANPKPNKLNSLPKTQSNIPLFLQHIWAMVNDESVSHIIGWHPSIPNAFIIHNQSLFENQLLCKYFKHKKLSSFVRQLNMYQFRKIRDAKLTWQHSHLCRNKSHELTFIQRRDPSSSKSGRSVKALQKQNEEHAEQIKEMQSQITEMKEMITQQRTVMQDFMMKMSNFMTHTTAHWYTNGNGNGNVNQMQQEQYHYPQQQQHIQFPLSTTMGANTHAYHTTTSNQFEKANDREILSSAVLNDSNSSLRDTFNRSSFSLGGFSSFSLCSLESRYNNDNIKKTGNWNINDTCVSDHENNEIEIKQSQFNTNTNTNTNTNHMPFVEDIVDEQITTFPQSTPELHELPLKNNDNNNNNNNNINHIARTMSDGSLLTNLSNVTSPTNSAIPHHHHHHHHHHHNGFISPPPPLPLPPTSSIYSSTSFY